jgi:hypothetical protein
MANQCKISHQSYPGKFAETKIYPLGERNSRAYISLIWLKGHSEPQMEVSIEASSEDGPLEHMREIAAWMVLACEIMLGPNLRGWHSELQAKVAQDFWNSKSIVEDQP